MQTHSLVHTRPSLVVLPPPRHCSLLGGRHLKPRPRDRHPPANGSTPSLPFPTRPNVFFLVWGFSSSIVLMECHLDKITTCEVNVEVLPEQVHAWLFAVRAGPGKAAPAKSLALRQHGNSRPLRLYPDVMRRSPMCSDTLICTVTVIQ